MGIDEFESFQQTIEKKKKKGGFNEKSYPKVLRNVKNPDRIG